MTSTDIYTKLAGLDQQAQSPAQTSAGLVARDIPWTDQTVQQEVTSRLNLWSTAAPALKPDMLLQFAEAGINPTDPVGQWVIRTAVPALGSRAPDGSPTADANNAAQVLATPGILFQLAQMPLDQLTTALKQNASQVGGYDDATLKRYLASGSPNVHHSFWNKIGDIATTGTRGALLGAQTGLEATAGAIRNQGAGLATSVANIAHGDMPGAHQYTGGVPEGPADYKLSVPNPLHYLPMPSATYKPPAAARIESDWHIAGSKELLDPGQLTAVQAADYPLGNGFFPAGMAHEHAVLAQQAAFTINGHAMTPGRALAAFVTQPGTRPYSIMSGVIDSAVALNADPAAIVLSELSDTAKAARLFSPTSDAARMSTALHLVDVADSSTKMTALRAWAGDGENLTQAMLDKLKTDPGSLQQLVDQGIASHADVAHAIASPHAGMFSGLRQAVSPKDALTWINSKPGRQYADWAASHDFVDILTKSRGKMPVDVAAGLANASNADEVRGILGPALGTTVRGVPESALPYAWKRPFETVRWGHYLPKGSVDVENVDHAVTQALSELIAAKVPRAKWDEILKPIATATNQPEMFDAYVHGLSNQVRATLVERGVEPSLAKTLTTRFPNDWEEQRKFFTDEVGNTPHLPGYTNGGAPVPIDGPHLPSELLNRAIPPLNMREINRSVGVWGKAYHTPVLKEMLQGTTYLADSITGAFKVGALLKLALPVRFLADEQARMATAGLDSMFHNPLSFIAYAMGDKGTTDMLGVNWVDQLGDAQSTFRAAVGASSKWKGDIFQPDQIFAKHWVNYGRGSSGYTKSWADELSQLHIDPVAREVTKAVRDLNYAPAALRDVEGAPHGLDAVKEWFWSGPGQKYRHELAASNTWGGTSSQLMHDRQAADSYIESVVDRVKIKTGGHDDLLAAVAEGKPFAGVKIDKDFTKQLQGLSDGGIGPETVKGRAAVHANGRPAVVRHVVDRLFSVLMDTPTQTLTRSPAFRQAYWDRAQELMPYLGEGTQDQLLRVARNTGMDLTKSAEAQGVMGLAQADQVAKAHALKTVRDILYYPGERLGATDALRNIAPFGEAWRNVLTRWAKLAAENPVAGRRVEQGVTSLRESGFFHQQTDQNGNATEVFTLVPGNIMQHLAGVPFPLNAPVKGLNILGTGLPGVGPAVQIPAAAFMPHTPAFDEARKFLLPYGDPDFLGGAIESLFPGWLDKLKTAGWMMKASASGQASGSVNKLPFVGQTPDQARILDNLAKQVFQYKMSAGSYDLSNPDVLNQLTKDSLADAQKLYLLRGLAQFAAPAAPNYDPQTKLKDGSLLELSKLSRDYNDMYQAHDGDSYAATRDFITKYGPNRIFATEPKARRVVFGVPTSAEALVFKQQHSDFVSKFPTTYGYFAPQGGPQDYQTYLDAIKRGELQPLSVDEWAKLADARLGNAIYDQARQRLPASPTVAQRNWLTQVKAQIAKQYPGFDDDSLKVSSKNLGQTVNELRGAIADPTVKNTPLAVATETYIEARDRALAAARKRTGRDSTTLSGARMDDLRNWLYQVGTQIALQRPDFTNMWNRVFQSEVQPAENP